ncbi:MAG TPA: RAMP superfamily CRISPR-associated protein [Ktedonobacteraceae bacterium]|nr:RAMP superfamily CRISPR-associated protein [Ktedonobacteraceae bacterium]
MNPYDFVRIDWQTPPPRRAPSWHHRLTGEKKLYSGSLEIDIYAETPLFIGDPRSVSPDPRKPALSFKNGRDAYTIPGSSLKGLLRNVIETQGNGCLTLFDGRYERNKVDYYREVAPAFQHCSTTNELCIACRICGMLKDRSKEIFLGKINIGDAVVKPETLHLYDPLYTLPLMEPKPHHASFYLDESGKRIAGRKYYFHHNPDKEPAQENRLITFGRTPANRYIQPIERDTQFSCQLEFSNLEEDEFAVLMLAVTLEENMRHKIGYGKPMGLGSIYLYPVRLTLIDYSARYTRPGTTHGRSKYEGKQFWNAIGEPVDRFYDTMLNQNVMDDLRRIWLWQPEEGTIYRYPDKRGWFDLPQNRTKRIADTWDA